MDIDAEREKITKEIKELERILDPTSSSIHVEVSGSSLDSDSEADSLPSEDLDISGPPVSEEEKWGEASNDEDDPKDRALPEDPETCLQLNMVYQEVIQEKLAEVNLLLAQNREQQEEIMWDLSGSKGPKVKDGKSLPPNMYVGHFMKPYFKDRVTGVGPPANEDTREKAAQGIKAFEELLVTKWKNWEKALLRKSVVSDRLQRLLQPKLLKLEYLRQKQSRASGEPERQALEKQAQETEKEVQDISQLPEESLLGNRLDSHDWEKISKVNFEGGRSAEEIRKFWQNSEHPSINKQEWNKEEVERLRAIAAAHGLLEWQKVAEELGTSRSAFQCLQKFQQHNKALKRKEWTEEEDRMLTQLVQEMRVGSHIPYRRIVYYMEGRDSMQLIYRWTKSLDPSLKRGFWAPEEDAKLLQAVAKYGEQDWFKIREEVPGRSDAQCRDRYLRRLHFSLKKGRWSSQEEEQLIELIEKHGVGHWAKIASELPHRSGSQCLSKWKIMTGKKQSLQRRRRRPRCSVRWSSSSGSSGDSGSSGSSSSSSSSSSSNEDSETEQEEAREADQVLPSPQFVVPDMDLWVPARQSTSQPWRGGAGGWPGCPAASSGPPKWSNIAHGDNRAASATTLAPGEETSQAQTRCGTHSTLLRGVQYPRVADTHPVSREEPACEKERLRQSSLPNPPLEITPGDRVTGPPRQRLWHRTFQNGQRRRRHALHQRLLERRLLLAVTPWVGDIPLPCMQAPRRPTTVQTRADGVRKQLQHARLASTPVFTLFIQLFQIDTAGCMEVVGERKAQLSVPLQPGAGDLPPHLQQGPSSTQSTPGRLFPNVPARGAAKSASHKGSRGLESCQAKSIPSQVPLPAPCGPRPKPKTVSELLREKRLREARARKAAQGPTVLPPQLLISSPVIFQPPLPPAPHGSPAPTLSNPALSGPEAPTVASPCAPGSWQDVGTSAKGKRPPTLQALLPSSTSTGAEGTAPAASKTPALGPGQVPVSCCQLGQSQAPATSQKQGLPKVPALLPAAPSPTQLPIQPLSLTPAVGTHRAVSHMVANIPLPVTWVLTAQGLLPVPVPAVVGFPRPAGTSDPTGLPMTLLPARTETQVAQSPRDMEPDLSSRTDPSTPPATPTSQSPVEVDGDVAQAARETSVPRPASQANHPAAEPPWSSPGTGPGSGPGGTLASPSGTHEPTGLRGLERQPLPRSEKGALDLGLLSQESEAATREWLRGQQGVCVPPLGSRLPYQPPALCSLQVLSSLLLHKKVLELKATSLAAGRLAGGKTEPQARALQASLGMVRRQLQDNPAYLLLKARFLAVFTLPALLATLSPHGIPTTLSAATMVGPESEDEDLMDELEHTDGDKQLGCTAGRAQAGPAATIPVQGAPDSSKGSSPSYLDTSDDLDVLRTRHARHIRKRRRLAMSDYENEDQCWSTLESFRVKLISVIDPSRITPYLRQCKVLNLDDEEQVLSDPNLVIRKRKVGVLLDILQRTGHKGYVAFLESLELYYPQLYKKVTGKEPTRVFSMIIDASGESGLTQLLMSEVMKLQKKVQDLTALLSSKDDFIKELRVKDSLLRKHQERVQRLKEESEACGRELKRCKNENYDLAMRLARQSEEKGAALMRNRDLQLEIDRLKHSLMKAEDDCKVERKHTLKLRHAMEQRPSQELLWELQQEKALLQARVQELEASVQEGKLDRSSPYIQVLEEDWRQALRDHQEQANTIFSLRKDLRRAEVLRARCLEEKETFELQCLALRKDSKMYKDRIEAILQQMEEVAIERDQAISSREELHAQYARSLQEKDGLRKRVRELGEKADELQLLLFQREGQLLAAEGRLKRQQPETLVLSSDLEDSSPRNSQELSLPQDLEEDAQLSDKGGLAEVESSEPPFGPLQKERLSLTPNDAGLSSGEPPEKERRRLKESFENYRRKRALRKMQNGWRQGEVDRENTTGSDNTDTEGC
ncbi:snRNA-activating protein complex subunit 4 isoform X2 [Cynocephalus volans]|uniref:snRNA-activating protein complex subunit 4 isoform X2 n=1 Tax=Cynocephalus volans TaxID=110931 RepID=UPI002FCAF668